MTAVAIAALLRPVSGYTGPCAGSPIGVDDDVPVGGGRFENVVAIGKLIDAGGRVAGWIYKTDGGHLRIQRTYPSLDLRTRSPANAHTVSGVDPLRGSYPGVMAPCTPGDFRYRVPR